VRESAIPGPGPFVRKRDGRLVPFDPDKIAQALFAATEAIGRPDAFLGRELTDGVLYFLAQENEVHPLTTQSIAEVVVKVVRELGQPTLAEAFAAFGRQKAVGPQLLSQTDRDLSSRTYDRPDIVLRFGATTPLNEYVPACTRHFSLNAVYHRDVAAAHRDGLLTLTGLEAPNQLASLTLSPAHAATDRAAGALGELEVVRRSAGQSIAIDGAEYRYAQLTEAPTSFVRDLTVGLRLTNLQAAINLNSASAPPWVGDVGDSPLFVGQGSDIQAVQTAELADSLLTELGEIKPALQHVRIHWHLAEADFGPERSGRLHRILRFALEGSPVTFVFNRPRMAQSLAEGMDRQHPTVLGVVGLGLPHLARHPRVAGEQGMFLDKLGSLARLAVSAGVQKREYLRRLERSWGSGAAALGSGFLLDRARLVVVPVGLECVVRMLTGHGLGEEPAALKVGCEIIRRLAESLGHAGRQVYLDACLDGTFDFTIADTPGRQLFPAADNAAGVTGWDPALAVADQLRVAGALHEAAGAGTMALFAPAHAPTVEQASDWLARAWKTPAVRRLQLLMRHPAEHQLTFGGDRPDGL